MMIYPPIAELVKRAGSRYALVIEAAQRARQLSQGATPLCKVDSNKEVAIAANEIYEGKISAVMPDQIQPHNENSGDDSNSVDDAEAAEKTEETEVASDDADESAE